MRRFIPSIALAVLATGAGAAEVSIELPDTDDVTVERNQVEYDCAGRGIAVEYVNAGPVSFAVFAFEGEPVVASNVLAASGARYAGGRFIWWTKGPEAFLYDLTQGEGAAPVAECTERR